MDYGTFNGYGFINGSSGSYTGMLSISAWTVLLHLVMKELNKRSRCLWNLHLALSPDVLSWVLRWSHWRR